MRVDRVILRAVLSTLSAIIVLFATMLLALIFLFPSTSMRLAYDLGLDGVSIACAKRAYAQTEETCYIAFATETAIGSDNDERIIECGLQFIKDNPQAFEAYCAEYQTKLTGVDGTYKQYVYGQVSLAQYRQGQKAEAITTAFADLQTAFPKNNAAVVLAMTAVQAGDTETVSLMKTEMNELSEKLTDTIEKEYLANVLALCDRVG